jgi:hypothetical protein
MLNFRFLVFLVVSIVELEGRGGQREEGRGKRGAERPCL